MTSYRIEPVHLEPVQLCARCSDDHSYPNLFGNDQAVLAVPPDQLHVYQPSVKTREPLEKKAQHEKRKSHLNR